MIFMNKNLIFHISDILMVNRKKENISTEDKKFHTFGYRLDGSCNFLFENETLTVSKGELVYIPPHTSYRQNTEGEKIVAIHTDIYNSIQNKFAKFKFKDTEKSDKLFLDLHNCWDAKAKDYNYKSLSLLYEIFTLIQTETPDILTHSSKNELLLLPAVDYIKKNYTKSNFSIQDLSELIGVSSVYFRKIFKLTYNVSPLKYINMLRINKAISLIKYGDYSIHSISKAVGYEDPSYFSRVFKQHLGKSPCDFRCTVSSEKSQHDKEHSGSY